ncbi:MAG TPA: DoxX family protein [Micromonosporaceae bacterium]
MTPVRTVARAMLGTIFVVTGSRALTRPEPFTPAAEQVADRLGPVLERAPAAMPRDPRSLVRLNGAVHVLGGLLLMTRFSRPAAAALAGSLVPTTLAAHPFWSMDDPGARQGQQIQFMKNLGLFGGLLLAAADTEGRPGLRWRTRHYLHDTRHYLHDVNKSARRVAKNTTKQAQIAVRAANAGRHLPG